MPFKHNNPHLAKHNFTDRQTDRQMERRKSLWIRHTNMLTGLPLTMLAEAFIENLLHLAFALHPLLRMAEKVLIKRYPACAFHHDG